MNRSSVDILREIDASPQCRRVRRSQRLRSTIKTVNRAEYLLFDEIKTPKEPPGVFTSPDGTQVRILTVRVARSLFNYVNTAYAVVEHWKALDEDLFNELEAEERPSLNQFLIALKSEPWYPLMHGIRQVFMHHSIPELIKLPSDYALTSRSLLKWPKWKLENRYKMAYKHLIKYDQIGIRPLAVNFKAQVGKVLGLYMEEANKFLAEDLALYNTFVQQYEELLIDEAKHSLKSVLQKKKQGKVDLELLLMRLLPTTEWKLIATAGTDDKATIIVRVLKRYGIDAEESLIEDVMRS